MSDYDRIAEHFASDSASLTLKVCREDGVYRHLEFTGGAGWTKVLLITWPYNLLVAGSHGSFHFERFGKDTEDMLVWLRGMSGRRFNPASWASKLLNGSESVARYERNKLEAEIEERVAEAVSDDWAPEGLREAVRDELLESHWLDDKQNALRMIDEFEHGKTYRSECSCGAGQDHDDYGSATTWQFYKHKTGDDHKVTIRETGGFDFGDIYDWNVDGLDYHYVWQCAAAVWGIRRYDKLTRYGLTKLAVPKAVS